ncbi:MAG: hypothetical protein Fur0043_06340 [Anaerolineales bacterium]
MKRLFPSILIGLLFLTACSAANELTGNWQLQAYGPLSSPIPAQANAYLNFAHGTVSGNTGCNSLSGQYRVINHRLFFSDLFVTLIACVDTATMDQESLFLNALNTNSGFSRQGNHLTIYYNNGKQALEFQRIP